MLNIRYKLGVITYHDIVIAMGGKSDPVSVHDSIEVMNFRYHPQWKEASVHLPVPMWNIKPTMSGEKVVIIGYSHAEARSDGSYEISIASLLGHPLSTKQWSELCPPPSHNTAMPPFPIQIHQYLLLISLQVLPHLKLLFMTGQPIHGGRLLIH